MKTKIESQLGKKSFLIWDVEGVPPSGEWTTILWSGFEIPGLSDQVSMPMLVEEHADILKSRYLEWIYDLGELQINDKRVIDHLRLRPGFSYWWMTSLAQKFNASGTSEIVNAIKAFALEDLVSEHKPISIELVSDNIKIAATLRNYCRNSELEFQWNTERNVEKRLVNMRNVYRNLPYVLQASIFFVRYIFRAISLVRKKHNVSKELDGEICFMDILVHLDRRAISTGKFISNYWTSLVDKLSKSNIRTSWLHNYYYQKSIPSWTRSSELLGCFNSHSNNIQSHLLVEENIGLLVIIKALRDYCKLYRASFRLKKLKFDFNRQNSAMDLWPLFQQEWNESLRGQSAFLYSLRLSLYEKTFKSIPHFKTGVYIMENQPWEMALIHSWKAAGHGRLIGVPHTIVRYWDLRYFYDPRSYGETGKNILPKPDLVAVNGSVANKMYLEWGYPELQIKKVEALRFIHLLNSTPEKPSIRSPTSALKVLICGDFLLANNEKMLSWLETAAQNMPHGTSYILKPHPACSIKLNKQYSLSLEITDKLLAELFIECDVVFTSNNASSSVDAYCSGISVVQMFDSDNLNMSPLRNIASVQYVKNPSELAGALRNSQRIEYRESIRYFYLDKKLSLWQKLLNIDLIDSNE